MAKRVLILVLCCFSLPVLGSEVLRVAKDSTNIAISIDPKRTWSPKDRVCVLQRAREVACGTVVKATPKGAIVRLDQANYDVLAGDKIVGKAASATAAQPEKASKSAPLLDSVPSSPESDIHTFNLSLGVSVGTSFFFPTLNFQVAITPALALGLTGNFFSYTNDPYSLMAFGGIATLNYYSDEYFRGLWIQAGGGMMMFSLSGASTPQNATSLLGVGTVGWRGYWDFGVNIGLGAGLQYISDPSFTQITTSSTGIKPVLVLDFGISF